MRITFVLPSLDLTGGQRVVAIYADKLRRRGHHVAVVAVREASPSLRAVVRALVKERRWLRRPAQQPSHFDGLQLDLRRLPHSGPVTDRDVPDADVVVATWWETARWVTQLSPAKGVPVHIVQDYESWGGTAEEIAAVYRLPLPKIVISGWMQDLLAKKFGQQPLALILNSVDPAHFHAPPRGKQAVPAVGMAYAPTERKGTDIGLKAYELAAKQIPNLRLRTISNVEPDPAYPLPPGMDFTLKARDQQLRDIYAGCDAWLFPSRWEGFGLPILEAMACRTPVIGTPAGAAPDLLKHGGGILVPHNDPTAMAEAIVKVCQMPDDEWRRLSDAALATATATTWDDAAGRFEQALQEARIGRARVECNG